MVDNSPSREIVVQVLDIRKVNHDKKDMFSLVGLSTTKEDLFAHRPYHSKSELWGTGRSLFAKIPSEGESHVRVEFWIDKAKIGHAILELDTKEAVGKEHKAWYPLKPAGEVHLSLKWNTVEVKVGGRNELLKSIFGAKPHDVMDLDLSVPRQERPFWKEYLVRAEKLLDEGTPLPETLILSVLKGNLESMTKKNVVRVFVSSTFTDTETERNRLMADVYPYLNLLCKKIGLEFETVDMRWGVREFTNDNHQTSELCMKELAKCLNLSVGPAFFCLLGNKYGYRPFPAKISHDILNTMWPRICESELASADPALAEKLEKTKVEHVLDVLTDEEKMHIYNLSDILYIPQWFWLNLNVNPPVFDLQNITTHLPHFRSTNTEERNQASGQWWRIFETMQLLLRKGATALSKEEEERYIISVTNEEVFNGILNNPNYKEQTVLLARRIKDGESIREDGALRKFIDASSNAPIPLVTFPPPPGPPPPKPPSSALSLDCEATSLLAHLKDQVFAMVPPSALLDYVIDKRHLGSEKEDMIAPGEKIEDAGAGKLRKGEAQERYIRELCEVTCKSLGDHIIEGFRKNNLATSAVFQEVARHHSFLKIKLRGYVERSKLQDSILAYCDKEEANNKAFVVYAPSGAGKTALVAWVANKIHHLHPKATVITRFLGTTPASSDVLLLVRSLCQQLMAVFSEEKPEDMEVAKNGIPEEVNTLFLRLLSLAEAKNEEVFLFIDSIDQLLPNNNAYMLDWLPIELPAHVHLIVSVLIPSAEEEANPNLTKTRPPNLFALLQTKYDALKAKDHYFCHIPQLIPSEAEQIVDSKLALPDEHGRTKILSKEQKAVVVKNTGTSFTPLYLCIALDLAVQWKSYTPIAECSLAGTTRDIILQLFRKLESVHGKLLVSHALGYLTASKYGLSSQDMEDILSCDDEVLNDVYQWWLPPVRRLPPLLWKRLKEDLAGYLVEKGLGSFTLISWFHRQFKEAAEDEYLSGEAFLARNRVLAKYFDGSLGATDRFIPPQPLRYSQVKFNNHKITSLPYHQAFIDPTLFHSSLYNLEFIEDKIRADMPAELIRDYEFAISLLQRNPESQQQFGDHIAKLKDIQDFLKSNLNILLQNPSLILMLALNQPDESPVNSLAVEQRVLQLINKEAPLKGVLTMEHQGTVDFVHFVSNDERVVAHTAKSIKVYDVTTGLELLSIPKDNHKGVSTSLPGGKLVCINRGRTRIYDANTGAEIGSFEDYDSMIREYAALYDQKTLIILGKVGSKVTVEVWDYISMTFLRHLPGPDGATKIQHSLDGKLLFTYSPGASGLSIYDPHAGKLVQTLEFPKIIHYSCFSADGAYVYAAGYDGDVFVSEVATGKILATTKAHEVALKRVVSSSVGHRIATGSVDKTIKLWDSSTPELKEVAHLKGHTDNVEQIFFSEDGKKLLSVSDTNVIVWDTTTGEQLASLKGHSGRVFSGSFSRDTTKVLTGSVDRTMRLWDLTARVEVKESPHHTKEVVKSKYSLNGRIAVTASDDQMLKVWDPQGKLLRTIPQDKKWDPNFAIDPNGELIFTVLNKNLLAFNAHTGETVLNVKAHAREMYPYCLVSSSGLVATFTDKEAKLWDCKTFKEIKKFGGHEEEIHIIAFSPDGTHFVTVSTDTLAVWNIKTGKKIHDLGGPDNSLRILEYTPNAKYLVGYGAGVYVWSFVADPEVTSTGTEVVMLAVPQCEASLILYIPSSDYRLSAFDMAADPVDIPVHVHKALARLLCYQDEVWTWAHNELVLWKVKNGGKEVQKETQFFVPRSIASLARHNNLLLVGTTEGTVYHFVIQ